MAGESVHHIAAARARNFGLPAAAGMDLRLITPLVVALDVCTRSPVSGQAVMKLILAVFGIAGILIVVWVILRIFVSKSRE